MRALPRAKAVLGTFSSTRAGRLIDLLIYQPECKMPELHSLMFALCQIQVPSVRIVYWVKGHVLLLSAIPAMHQLLPCCSGNAAVSTRGIPRKRRFQPSPKRLFQVQQKGFMPSEGHFPRACICLVYRQSLYVQASASDLFRTCEYATDAPRARPII